MVTNTASPHDPSAAYPPRGALLASYANYFEVGHNAFEFLIDSGQVEPQSGEIQLISRIAFSPVHAKLLSQLLSQAITQFEAAFHAIPDLGEPEAELPILSPDEFEHRAMLARTSPNQVR